ncbi:MAG: tetratricopeptide repeat protein [Candidatus Thalassarchaeaceae archaeon]|nr:tetratricopeptide repeat protein [Candidatus Thalassarchaeaceae archaeon]MDP7256725.1 tetratricopeptide repeat protein [Candidatus Thalassarchaeaceae archaeon]MDP7649398.1 tetratricopeptide repeat protein [Candidatus Thalassarchaeaceae archaeon]HJM77198.1 tetratricopeptide repeat protein [Candidatus Thalassarchaeaceae archaeon]HJO84294.1 tetratricopeptide repeat protein [Candidatus Thalassarchaeaceae archaeon]|tara:strand:- start:35048 stop:36253 length:1206 start_codon:yes stop_codon:yes gene_type:complete
MEQGSIASQLQEAGSMAKRGDTTAAIEAYEEVIAHDAENATAWYCLGVLYSNQGSAERAIVSFKEVDRLLPNHGPTLSNLAILLEEEDPPRASEYARAAHISYPDNKALARISSASDDHPPRVFLQASPLSEPSEGQPDEGGITLDSEEPSPMSSESMMIEAESHTSAGNHAAAVSVWKGLLEGAQDSPEVWRGLGDALEAAGYPDRAAQCRQRADSIGEAQYQAVTPVALDEDELEEALVQAALTHSNEESPPFERSGDLNASIEWYNKGLSLLQEDKATEALTCFEKAIGGCPKEEVELRVRAQNGRGHALFKSSRFAESVLAYHTAINMDSKSVTGRTLFNMGSSYAAVELYEDAIKCFTQSLERGLDKEDAELCEKHISRCRLLSREQLKRQTRASR